MIALRDAMAHLRELVEGQWAGATHAITAGRFQPTDDRRPLAEQPEHGCHLRYELVPTKWDDAMAETGRANLSGQLVDSQAELVLQVAYLQGGGNDGSQDATSAQMAEDAYLLRRVLSHPDNFDGQNTGIMDCSFTTANFTVPKAPERRRLLTMGLVLLLRDDWTTE